MAEEKKDGAGGAGGDGQGAGGGAGDDKKGGGDKDKAAADQVAIDRATKDAFGRGAGKVLNALGVTDDAEAIELVRLGREARKAAEERAKNGDKGGAGGDSKDLETTIQQRVQSALEPVTKAHAKELDGAKQEGQRWRGVAESALIDNALMAAAGKFGAIDPAEVSALLRKRVRITNAGTVEVLKEDEKEVAYGDGGALLTVDGLVKGYLTSRPHHLPAGTKAGAGERDSKAGDSRGKTMTRAEYEALDQKERTRRLAEGGWTIA